MAQVDSADFEADLVRPDDLLTLHVAGYNFNFQIVPGHDTPALGRIDATKDAFLVVAFPPQSIAETAYFEKAPPGPPPDLPPGVMPRPDPPQLPPALPGHVLPGRVGARLSGVTRLVFRLAARAPMPVIPYSIEGLLDWSGFEPVVTPLADLPPTPTPAQIATAPGIAPPGAKETAIELPYRLILSPDHTVTWLHSAAPVTHASRTELWHTQLIRKNGGAIATPLSPTNTAPLRAIWSPDYNPARAHDESLCPTPAKLDPDLGVTDISPNDRHQIVILTSVFRGYADQHDAPFMPTPIDAQMLMLSPLGGWLRSRGHWDPPKAVEKLDLSEWVHVAAQGRDHYARIVYEGHLYPFGHRAALIKITERKFRDIALPDGSTTPVAYMFQREHIMVREPEKVYMGQLTGHTGEVAGRKLPLAKVRLTTLVTPDLTLPRTLPNINVPGSSPSSFWVVMGPPPGQDFAFHAVATDIAGNEIEFTASLIFASLTDTGSNPSTLPSIQAAYAGSGSRRACLVPMQKMTYAPRHPTDASTDNTTLTTSALYFDTDTFAQLNASFGGYFPRLFKAEVHIPAIEQLVGASTATTIDLYDDYINGGLDANAGVFAQIVKEVGGALVPDQLPITFSADKAGGIATPNLNISNLTRAFGPLAGKAGNAAQDLFDAGDFFGGFSPDQLPKLFGSINLTDLLPIPTGGVNPSASKNAPKTQFSTIDGSKTLLVTFDWAPDVRPVDASFASFTPNDNGTTALTIHGEIRKPVAIPPTPAGAGSFAFDGKLTHFRVDILHAIALHFATFSFSAGSNKKLNVTVDLGDPPFEFEGDLAFLQDLSNIIPPGAFGDNGPSIDLTWAPDPGVHVGYGVTLPPAAVGVFSLENIKLSAGLDLPLLSGKPIIDLGFAERHHPFLLTVSLLGGGGFLHVQLDTEGMKMLEAAFEFGANVSINLGVASGGVHIMAGIYFSMQTDAGKTPPTKATLAGYLRMGGELSVLGLISVSIEFMLTLSYDSHKASGRATLTVAVKVLFFSKSVEISVEKQFGGSGSDPTFAQLITSPVVWGDYASKFA